MSKKLRFIWRAYRYRRLLDPGEIQTLLASIRPGDVAIDIGAHKGAYTYWMNRCVGSAGRVFAFEPQPALANYLQHAAASFNLPAVHVENMALSSSEGQVTIALPAGDTGPSPGAKIQPVPGSQSSPSDSSTTIPCTTLDAYFDHLAADLPGPVSFIKCDVEGHELDVFRGAVRTLEKHRPRLLFECEQRHHPADSIQDVFRFLEDIGGYTGSFFHGKETRPLMEFDPAVHQADDAEVYVNNFFFQPA